MNILLTGGCGYTGSVLVPKLLQAGHGVMVWDIQYFGNRLEPHERLIVLPFDIRHIFMPLDKVDVVIHLAAIANDPTGELDPRLTWETNALATQQLVEHAAKAGVKQFIYASSGSVYGVKGDTEVTEDEPCVPVSEYNKAKMVAERCVLSYQRGIMLYAKRVSAMGVVIVRPGTVCGWSPRQRLDISVNGLVMRALTTGKLKVAGSHLMRANVHIDDLTDLYVWLLSMRGTGIYNAAFENASLEEIALKIQAKIPCEIEEIPVTDPRSYRINSDAVRNDGFTPRYSIDRAIDDLLIKHGEGQLVDSADNYNLKVMAKWSGS